MELDMLELDPALEDVFLHEEPTVPPAAATVRTIAELERRGDLDVHELRRVAFADPGIAAELLGAASARAGDPLVSSLPIAAALLGEAELVRIVRAAGRDPAPTSGPLAALRLRAWRSAVVSAMLCRELARERGLPPDEAYACGLLHDIGRIAALAIVERLAGETRAVRPPPLGRWEGLVDRWHVALGASVAERLTLPRPVLEAISFHHPERTRVDRPSPLLRVVRSIDVLVRVLDGSDSGQAVEGAELSAREATRLARAVDPVRAHVAALERRPVAADPAGAAVPAPLPPLHEPRGDGVRLRLAGAEYVAVGFARHQLLVRGPAPLGEGALLEVEVLDRRRAPFHARVLTTWEEGRRFGAILLPLGLSGPSLAEVGGTLPAGASA